MTSYSSSSRQEIAVLVIDQDTRVSQRISLQPDRDLISYVDLLSALGQQLGPLFKSKKEHQNRGNNNNHNIRSSTPDQIIVGDQEEENNRNNNADDDDDTIYLPPEATNLLVFDKEIGTYVPLSDPPSSCIGDKSRLLIDFVPLSPARMQSRNSSQHQQQLPASRPGTSMGLNSSTNSDLPPTFPISKNSYNNELPPRPESPSTQFRRSAPTPPPPADFSTNANNNNNNSNTSVGIPRQPSGSMVSVVAPQSSSSFVSSPISSLEPEMLLIEVSAKLLGDLAAASSSSAKHGGPSTSASLVSDSVERRLAKLPVIIQEKAVGAWSRAIAEGFEISKHRRDSSELYNDNNTNNSSPLRSTLDAVLADRDALLVSFRNALSEIEEFKKRLRIQEDAIHLASNWNLANNGSAAANFSASETGSGLLQQQDRLAKKQKIVNEHQKDQIARLQQDLQTLRERFVLEHFMKKESESRLEIAMAAFITNPDPLPVFLPFTFDSTINNNNNNNNNNGDDNNIYERPVSRVGFAADREQGEKDPGRYLRDEINDEAEDDENDEGVDAKDEEEKFKSRYAQQQPQHRDFTQRYKNSSSSSSQQQQQQQQVSPPSKNSYYQVEVSPTNVSEKSDSLTPLPTTRTIASPVQQQQQQQQPVDATTATTSNTLQQERQATAPHNYWSGRSQSKDVFNGATNVAIFAHQQQNAPSSRPLSATLRKIMEDTDPKREQRLQLAGSTSVFVSHIPPDDNNDATGKPKQRRVGVVYSDPQFSHVPGGQRGTKSFLVADPPTVDDIIFAAARALMVATTQIAVGYWAADGVTPILIKEDERLLKYLNDQPRIVPFVQCFVVGASYAAQKNQDASNNSYNVNQGFVNGGGSGAVSGFRPSRPMSAPTAARPQQQQQSATSSSSILHLPHNYSMNNANNNNNTSSHSYYNHLGSDFVPSATNDASKVSRPSSASSAARQQLWTGTNFAKTADNSRRTDQTIVIKSEHSERGLEVLPPNPSEESKSSPWRLRLDGTPPPVHSAVASRHVGGKINNSHQNNNTSYHSSSAIRGASMLMSNSTTSIPDQIVDPSTQWEPLYRKQQQQQNHFVSSRPTSAQSRTSGEGNNHNTSGVQHPASITWGGRGAAKSVQVFNSGVKEEEFDQLFQELCDEACTDSQTQGVPPSVLLRYLDRNFDHMGDQRRFERLIGSYFCRSMLSRDELTLIMLKLAKE